MTTASMHLHTLQHMLHDHHQAGLDMSAALSEEALLRQLLDEVQKHERYLTISKCPLLSLPEEILEGILANLSPASLCQSEYTCQTLHDAAKDIWRQRDERLTDNGSISQLSSKYSPKSRVLKYTAASRYAERVHKQSRQHNIPIDHFSDPKCPSCKYCSTYPERLDTQPLHLSDNFDIFSRIVHGRGVIFEGFLPVVSRTDVRIPTRADNTETGSGSTLQYPSLDMSGLPIDMTLSWTELSDFLRAISLPVSNKDFLLQVQEAAHALLESLEVSVVAFPHNDGLMPASKVEPMAPTLVATAFGNRFKTEWDADIPIKFSHKITIPGSESGQSFVNFEDALAEIRKGGEIKIPLEATPVVSHVQRLGVNSSRQSSFFSTISMSLRIRLPADTRPAVAEGLLPAHLGSFIGLDFPSVEQNHRTFGSSTTISAMTFSEEELEDMNDPYVLF